MCSPGGANGKNLICSMQKAETQVRFVGQEDPLEEGMKTHSSILAWRFPRTKEPGRLQSIGLQSRTQLKRLSMPAHHVIGAQ